MSQLGHYWKKIKFSGRKRAFPINAVQSVIHVTLTAGVVLGDHRALVHVALMQSICHQRTSIGRFMGGVPDGDTTDGGGQSSDPIQNKQTQYGSSLLKKLAEAKSGGFLDDIDIFRLAGIKPKYQNALLGGV